MKMKELQEQLADTMRRWQKIEDASVASTGKIIEESDNPLVKLVMEIIQRDSEMHRRVQQMVLDSLEQQAVVLTPDDVAAVWEQIEKHRALERETTRLAEEALEVLKDKRHFAVQAYCLRYLSRDEEKHNAMLNALDNVKKGLYPYG